MSNFPNFITVAEGLTATQVSCPYAGMPLDCNCMQNNKEKYMRWVINEAALFPPDHAYYQSGLKTFINELIVYYDNYHDLTHQFPLRDYLTEQELV